MGWDRIGGGSYKYDIYRHNNESPKWSLPVFILVCLVFGFAAKGCNDFLVGAEPTPWQQEHLRYEEPAASSDLPISGSPLDRELTLLLVCFAPNALLLFAATTGMSSVMKGFCMAGLGSGIMLCVFDWSTSIDGFNQLMTGSGNAREGFITTFLPMTFGTLALAFNACSSYFFAMFLRNHGQFTDFSTSVTSLLWGLFVLYDGISSVIGILSTFSGVTISGFAGFQEASSNLGPFGTVFGILVAALLALSPFITAMFGELLKDQAG